MQQQETFYNLTRNGTIKARDGSYKLEFAIFAEILYDRDTLDSKNQDLA